MVGGYHAPSSPRPGHGLTLVLRMVNLRVSMVPGLAACPQGAWSSPFWQKHVNKWPAGVLLFLLSEGENLITVLKLGSCPPPSSSVKACLLVSLTLSWQCFTTFTWATFLGCSYCLIFLLLLMDIIDSDNKKTLQILPRISQNCWLEGNVMWQVLSC